MVGLGVRQRRGRVWSGGVWLGYGRERVRVE